MKTLLINFDRIDFNLNSIKFSTFEDWVEKGDNSWKYKNEFKTSIMGNSKNKKLRDLLTFLEERNIGDMKTLARDLFLNCSISFELKERWKKLIEDDIQSQLENSRMNLQELAEYLDKNCIYYKINLTGDFGIRLTLTFVIKDEEGKDVEEIVLMDLSYRFITKFSAEETCEK